MARPDYRDMALEILADSEAELREQVVSLTADVEAYRFLSRQAIHALRAVTLQLDRALQLTRERRELSQERAA